MISHTSHDLDLMMPGHSCRILRQELCSNYEIFSDKGNVYSINHGNTSICFTVELAAFYEGVLVNDVEVDVLTKI